MTDELSNAAGGGAVPPEQGLKCPRCDSPNTKFCYYNNYSLSQPRHYCKTCRRYWTKGGALRNVPVGGGCRKNKRSSRRFLFFYLFSLRRRRRPWDCEQQHRLVDRVVELHQPRPSLEAAEAEARRVFQGRDVVFGAFDSGAVGRHVVSRRRGFGAGEQFDGRQGLRQRRHCGVARGAFQLCHGHARYHRSRHISPRRRRQQRWDLGRKSVAGMERRHAAIWHATLEDYLIQVIKLGIQC
ncbi:uncharacterized protein LOC122026477 [Zingiber officinale]|uniref:uncharacterized protein LOC122026477 n=1 Tax=Zingiber officinale TaxID=94328 RepID=UPI001C4C0825|nr:uncharacterized protein LOC122026477 [Zingiber officinale]